MLESTGPEQTHYLKQILDNSPDGIFTISTELEIRYVNPAFCRLLGFAQEELLGTPITSYLGDLNILDNCMAEVAATGKCSDQETIFKRKDGSVVHISKNVQAITDEQGQIREILVSIRDLTDLHRLNRDLEESKHKLERQTQDLQRTLDDLRAAQHQLIEAEKLASLGSLVAGVAHEINTPLGISVTSASSIQHELDVLRARFNEGNLKRTEFEQFMDQALQACLILQQNLQRASELVNSFKRVAVDQTLDEWRPVRLRDYCGEILTSLGPKLKHRAIRVDNQCTEDLEFYTNPGAIYQILSNLLLNSLTHAYDRRDRGTISIDAHRDGNLVVIDYRDDGKGIASDNLKRIFEPFFTTRRTQGGTGLGLSIVYNLVTGPLKGSVIVDSVEGQGTHFRISIPALCAVSA